LRDADLQGADLRGASLERANLVRTKLGKAKLEDCRVYGLSAWDVDLTKATQANLVITRYDQPRVTVDDLEVAQFVYLLINNQRIRKVIDTVTSKVVLILGRFSPERKAVLDTLRAELRRHNYVPVLFDFDGPTRRDLDETVSILAHMARFIIADLTDARSLPQELKGIVESLPSVPVQPLLLESEAEWAMFERFTRYPWVLPVVRYRDQQHLLKNLAARVIRPAERMVANSTGR
jgi:uncharacterized protein YjbI with pentapeptide repeats